MKFVRSGLAGLKVGRNLTSQSRSTFLEPDFRGDLLARFVMCSRSGREEGTQRSLVSRWRANSSITALDAEISEEDLNFWLVLVFFVCFVLFENVWKKPKDAKFPRVNVRTLPSTTLHSILT